ncbi:MAG: binding 1 protein [Parcubacteria group bacterium]|nr:binding 1 protein [Parcubacteria group bacterium]
MSYFIKSKATKIVAGVIGFTMALSLFVGVGAQTTNAQGISLSDIIELFISMGIISSDKAAQARATLATQTSATFTLDLKQNSRGTEVMNLQKKLNTDSATQVSSSGAGSPGNESSFFGSKTKAALIKYQIMKGITATGMVDAATRAELNRVSTTVTTSSSSSVTTTSSSSSVSTVAGDGKDGSVTLSIDSYVGNQTVKKGETKNILAVKAQATVGDVTVSRFDVRFSKRPWLYFNQLVLKTSDGTVIATKNISSASDATEITVGSDYLVRFDAVNYVVKPGADKILVVSGSVLPSTDQSGTTMTVQTGTGGVRTINGLGYTDSLTVSTARTITYNATGSIGEINARLNSGSPTARIVTTSTSGETSGVTLGIFDFKALNTASKINSLTFTLNSTNGNNLVDFAQLLKRTTLTDGATTYNGSYTASTTVFSNLNIDLGTVDTWKAWTLKADVADADDFTNGVMASSSLAVATQIVGIDANYQTTTYGINTVTSNDITFLQSGASLSNMSASQTPNDNGTTAVATSTATFVFTLSNTGSNDIYVSKTPATFLATSTTSGSLGSLTLLSADSATLSGDTSSVYIIPSGSSRKFTIIGTYGKYSTSGVIEFKITKIYFDDDTSGLQEFNIDYGLESLRSVSTF